MKNIITTLVGDGIENPGNAITMMHAAEMYGVVCSFRDTKGLRAHRTIQAELDRQLPVITCSEIAEMHSRIIAFDNLPGAREVYGFNPGKDFAIVVGNERRGLSHKCRSLSSDAVQIPMLSRQINCLNVAAASAVAIHYLYHVKTGRMVKRHDPAKRRPELLMIGAENHIELGSAIRSATAFGWMRAFVEDRKQVWFGCDRVTRSEGRAAARRSRNRIRLIPCSSDLNHCFPEVVVVTKSRIGVPLHRLHLDRGPRQVVVIPDESGIQLEGEVWERFGREVKFAYVDTKVEDFPYHYRLLATLTMAEISRQVGQRLPGVRKPRRPAPIYDRALELIAGEVGEDVWLDDLLEY